MLYGIPCMRVDSVGNEAAFRLIHISVIARRGQGALVQSHGSIQFAGPGFRCFNAECPGVAASIPAGYTDLAAYFDPLYIFFWNPCCLA